MAQVLGATILAGLGLGGLHLGGLLDDAWVWFWNEGMTLRGWWLLVALATVGFLAWGTYQWRRERERDAPIPDLRPIHDHSPIPDAAVPSAPVTPDDLSQLQSYILELYVASKGETLTAEGVAALFEKNEVATHHALEDLESKGLLFSRHSASRGTSYGLNAEGRAFVVEHGFT